MEEKSSTDESFEASSSKPLILEEEKDASGSTSESPTETDEFFEHSEDQSPVEEVALTVDITDDPTIPVGTFRMWTLGLASCILLSFLNQFFSYRTEPFIITLISVQIVALPLGRFMAAVLPKRRVGVPLTGFSFDLNPGPFNVKEHVLITIFANAGSGFGNGGAYAMSIVNITRAFYKREINFVAGLLLVMTTQVLGYGWAGLMKKYLVEPAQMWWPGNLVQVSLFRTLHEEDKGKGLSRTQFFLIIMTLSFCYYVLPGYMFMMLTSVSWVCWIFPKSVVAQQLGSGLKGLGLGSFSLDWSTVTAYLGSPLVTPWFAIVNVMVGYLIIMYIVTPATYWGNVYNARTYPLFSSYLFTADGQEYDVKTVVDKSFNLDLDAYKRKGPIHMSTFFAFSYGLGFAAVAATLTHVACFHGKYIWERSRAAFTDKPDVHTRLMRKYPDVPQSWFLWLQIVTVVGSIATCTYYKEQLQLPWWGVILACVLASTFTLPIGVITATTNITPGLNIITEYLMGYLLPGKPMANVCFKTYGYISMSQAISFLQDFKLGHYMKIPPRSMFIVQFIGTVVAAVVNMVCAWWLLGSIENICDTSVLPPNSPWTCPSDRVFFDASVIWGLVGPKRIFGAGGEYNKLNWFFLGGALAPVLVWVSTKAFPRATWISQINMPVLIGSTAYMPPATSVNYISWCIVGFIFNFFIYTYRKRWWQRYNYVFSAAMDAGVAFMGVLLYLCLGFEGKSLDWWGNNVDNCPLAKCPTAKGVVVAGCPVL